MIQFNLLPDVKLEYIRTQRTKRLIMAISVLVSSVALVIMVVLLLTVLVFQKRHMDNLSADIKKYSNDLKSTDNLNKILTVQNQLGSLTTLHEQKPEVNRLIPYVKQVTPEGVRISSLDVDFTDQTINITGTADSLKLVNQFVDTLKFTNYTENKQSQKAFSNVVLTNFGSENGKASYSIDLNFVPDIFDNTKSVSLTVPKIVTTRSETEKPTALFEESTSTSQSGGNQ